MRADRGNKTSLNFNKEFVHQGDSNFSSHCISRDEQGKLTTTALK